MGKKSKLNLFLKKFVYWPVVLAVFLIFFGFFLVFNGSVGGIYVFPENPKQGDTVFIKIKSSAQNITGSFNNKNLLFYKKSEKEWVSFLGIDADQQVGNYNIFVSSSNLEYFSKEINIQLAEFFTLETVSAPHPSQPGQTKQKVAENIIKNDNSSLNKAIANLTEMPYFSGSFSYPLKKVENSGFSFGRLVGFAKYGLRHFGVDLRAPQDTDVYAVNDGRVVFVESLPNYGKTIIIDHGLGIFSMYLHLDEFKVSPANEVKNGQLIALSGDSGYSTAPHLHFSMRVNGSRVDPINFIKISKKVNENELVSALRGGWDNLIDSF